ncbi:MAG: hypothetical protein PHX18_03330 [Candidatus Gastranaerophilales bacterium]|nr:hypothetical protein [Candidatus Gastranaerophilales bacterium]
MIIKLNQINTNTCDKKIDSINPSRSNVTFANKPLPPAETARPAATMGIGGKIALAAGTLLGAVLLIKNRQKISNAARKVYYRFKGIETIKDEAGKLVPKETFVPEFLRKMNKIPGMSKLWDEIGTLDDRIYAKFENNRHFDMDYCRDVYRLNIMIPAEKLRYVRALKNPQEFADVIELCKKSDFRPSNGVMIYGKNQEEKKKLLDYFISEAKKQDVVVEHISTKGVTEQDQQIGGIISDAFANAKQRYQEQQKLTLIVMEDVDDVFKKDGSVIGGVWNTRTNHCGERGIFTLTTAQDINTLDQSAIRGGRIDFKFNIDEALIKQAETDKLKNVK